jgi:hypothetical protein
MPYELRQREGLTRPSIGLAKTTVSCFSDSAIPLSDPAVWTNAEAWTQGHLLYLLHDRGITEIDTSIGGEFQLSHRLHSNCNRLGTANPLRSIHLRPYLM